MRSRRVANVAALLLYLVSASACSSPAADSTGTASISDRPAQRRAEALRRARVWEPVPVERMDVRAGPDDPRGFPFLATVSCQYEDKALRGHSLKFACALPGGDSLKVKVGGSNGEVFAEVAASRLLWALGFGADHMYPVRVMCRGCPARFGGRDTPSGDDAFDAAVIERPLDGAVFPGDEGWAWWELDGVDPQHGGAAQAERDALTLAAAFLQHTDNKTEQQRLLCLGEPPARPAEQCARPLLMLNDVGLTFGAANFLNDNGMGSANFRAWSAEPIWKDPERCTANLRPSFSGSLSNPRIGEAGRQFLADLLMRLSDRQITDLFEVSRIAERRREVAVLTRSEPPATALAGGAPTAEWVRVFKQKRDVVATTRCR
ncbi:MAG TPA: hypothetical protein VNN99_12995 [Vicinamibacterales bacterium]|nr:hypothetical protein [Vicinamibacterales bacterium]